MEVLTTYKDIENTLQKEFVMILAKTHSCTACQSILTMLEHNIKNLEDIDIYNVFIDDMDRFRGEHLIFSVPTVLIYSHGKELLRESRYINYQKIERLINLYTH